MEKNTGTKTKGKLFVLLILTFFLVNNGYAQSTSNDRQTSFTVSGTVTDAQTGDPLVGVNILVVGTSMGGITNVNGHYSLTVPSLQDTLRFSYIGYQTKVVPISGRQTINIKLVSKVITGQQLVVVGYGTQQKGQVTGSISTVTAEDLNDVPAVTNISQALRGQVAGVRIQSTSTRPGASARIRIRGTRSLTASNAPLIVVNNIPYGGSLNDLNVNNIKSIEVLKDAAATAIYGSRGANGVILVTMKDGRPGPAQITYSGYMGVNTVARRYQVFNGPEFIAMRNLAGYRPYTNREMENKRTEDYTNWQDLMYTHGRVASHQLTISGGTDLTTYAVGGGYFYESTVLPGISFKKYSLNASLNQEIGDRIEIGFHNITTYQVRKGQSAGFMYPILTLTPLSPAFVDSTGALVRRPSYPNETYYNPLFVNKEKRWEERSKRITTFNNFYGKLHIYKGLNYRINIGLSYRQQQYGSYFGSRTPFRNGAANTAEVNNGRSIAYTIQNLLYYKKTIAEKNNIKLTALYSVHQSQEDNTLITNKNINANYLLYYNLGLSSSTPVVPADRQGYSKRGLLSYMLRVNYNYDHRYLLTLSGRRDGSSVLAEGHKWHSYYAIAVAWNIANETFMQNVNVVDNLKIRASFGETANQAIAPYTTLGALDQNLYNFGSNFVRGYYVSSLPNHSLGWEYTRSYNIGIDFSFFNSRISGSIDLYKQHTYNLLLSQRLPQTSGVPGSYLKNVGETLNKGLGIELSTVNIADDDFRWTTGLNFSLNRNKIVALNAGIQRNVANGWFVGHPINVIFDYKKVGIWQLTESLEAAEYGQRPGQIHVKDVNNDGDITGADRMILGTLNPDFTFGFTNHIYYKGFDLTIVTYGKVGGKLISTVYQPQSYLNMLSGRRNGMKVDYWTPTNPTNAFPKPTHLNGGTPLYGSTLGYFSATYFKIRSITLGYTLPERWLESIGGESLRIYANVKNVATFFSPYLEAGGVTPQPNGQGYQGVGGSDIPYRQLTIGANAPPVRTFALGIKITY